MAVIAGFPAEITTEERATNNEYLNQLLCPFEDFSSPLMRKARVKGSIAETSRYSR
jgi:hypothetical protein